MSDYLLADKAESAFTAILTPIVKALMNLDDSAFVPIFTSKDPTTRNAPLVEIVCTCGDEETHNTGNFWVDAEISVETLTKDQPGQAVPNKTYNQQLLSAVTNAILVDDLEAQLTAAASPFHVFADSVTRLGNSRPATTFDFGAKETIHLRFLACAADLS